MYMYICTFQSLKGTHSCVLFAQASIAINNTINKVPTIYKYNATHANQPAQAV